MFKPGFFLVSNHVLPQKSKPGIDNVILVKLTDLMDHQQYWQTEGLTIRQLAETMQVKEYRLRQTINQHLGFRNFNEFLNSYRIREACAILSNPKKQELIILEIAYDLGYQSLAPFNKAFKRVTGVTPTEYRKENNS